MLSYKESLKILKETKALLEGHFILSSGLHSDQYIQCAKLLSNPSQAKIICASLVEKILSTFKGINTVLSPALGGMIAGYEVARQLNVKNIFVERVGGELSLRRGFEINKKSKVLIVEDIVTTGGSVFELIDIVNKFKGEVVGVTSILDRNKKPIDFGVPYVPLVQYPVESWDEEDIPSWLDEIPLTQRGRSGKKS